MAKSALIGALGIKLNELRASSEQAARNASEGSSVASLINHLATVETAKKYVAAFCDLGCSLRTADLVGVRDFADVARAIVVARWWRWAVVHLDAIPNSG